MGLCWVLNLCGHGPGKARSQVLLFILSVRLRVNGGFDTDHKGISSGHGESAVFQCLHR